MKAQQKGQVEQIIQELNRRTREERSRDFAPVRPSDLNAFGVESNDQWGFLYSTANERWAFGGNRSGKTEIGVHDCDLFCRGEHPVRSTYRKPPVKVRYCAPKWRDGVEAVLLQKFKEVVQRHLLRGGSWQKAWVEKDHKLYYANGSTIHFKSYEEDINTYGGADLDAVYQDEHAPEKYYRENKARLADRNGYFVSTMTPEFGQTWERDHVTAPPDEIKVEYWFFTTLGNPYLSEEGVRQFRASLKDPALEQAKLYGQFVPLAGLVLPQYDPQCHLIADRDIPEKWYKVFCIDPHHKKPSAMVWAAWTPEDDLIVYRCEKVFLTVPELKQFIRAKSATERIDLWLGDEAMGGEGLNIFGQDSVLKQLASGTDALPIVPTSDASDKAFEAGIFKLREMLTRDPVSGKPSLYILRSCDWPVKHINGKPCGSLPWELARFEYRPEQKVDEETFRERVRTVNDDLISCVRYIAQAGPGGIRGSVTSALDGRWG